MRGTAKLEKRNIEDMFALVPMQEGILFHYLSESGSRQYYEQICLELSGEIRIKAFKKAWNFVIDTNEMLRTVFRWEEVRSPVQIVFKNYEAPVREYDLSGLQCGQKQEFIDKIREKDKESIDLKKLPLIITLLKIEEIKHLIVISNHHILYDGWSTGIILKEFFHAYDDLSNGLEPQRLTKRKYRDFVKWHKSQDREKQRRYWTEYLKGYEAGALLPSSLQKQGSIRRVRKYGYKLPEHLITKIHNLAHTLEITPAVFLYTAWGILLSKYNNVDDVMFGTAVSGRSLEFQGANDMVGLFINTLPLRVRMSWDEKVSSLLKNMHRALKDRDGFENTPFLDIKACAGIHNEQSLFDSFVVIENYPLDKILKRKHGVINIGAFSVFEMTNFDLVLQINIFEGIELSLLYNDEIFEGKTIERLAEHFVNIMGNMAGNTAKKLSRVEMIPDEEKRQILFEFNGVRKSYPEELTIHELFENKARLTPEREAILYGSMALSYRELNSKANQLAYLLIEKGIRSGSIAALMVERSPEMLIGILGILKAGCAYLPIDPACPGERVKYFLDDSGAGVLLANASFEGKIEFRGETIYLDNGEIYRGRDSNPGRLNSASGPAYIIYTSGSTGNPKGVVVEHSSVINTLSALQEKYPLLVGDSYLLKTAYTFDVSVTELFGWFFGDGSLVILESGKEKEPLTILEAIDKNNITHINFVPSMFGTFLNLLDEEAVPVLEKLKYVFVAGEAVSKEVVEKFFDTLENVRLENLYGPTEATIYATGFSFDRQKVEEVVPIGKPLPNTRAYITDTNLNLQPIGVIGELVLSGAGVARGYLNMPGQAQEKFLPDPFTPGERMYRTGDLARWLPSGDIEFLGRMDQQVKIRGFRVEAGEVECLLLKNEYIKEAVVVAKVDKYGNNYLCAYYLSDRKPAVQELREYLSERLPDYMIPSYFEGLEIIPLTPSGKVDRKYLRDRKDSLGTQENFEDPRNETEEKLADLWREILEIDKVGINDNFFELGGHSLRAMFLASRLHKELQVRMPIKVIFECKTIKNLAKYIITSDKSDFSPIQAVANNARSMAYFPASPAQRRLFVLENIEGKSTIYNMPQAMVVKGKLVQGQLEAAFKALINRHEALRTSFEIVDTEIVQRIHSDVDFRIQTMQGEESQLEKLLPGFVRPFDLNTAPLLRVGLLRLEDERYILFFDTHHIITDEMSMNILIRDLIHLYEGRELPELRLQYKDFTLWQNDFLKSGKIRKQEEYWLSVFQRGESSALPVQDIPTDHPRPPIQCFEGETVKWELRGELVEKMRELAKDRNVTLFMLLLANYYILLSVYSGMEDIVIGSPVAGRRHADAENIVGIFVNMLAIRNYPAQDKTFGEFLEEVKVNALDAYENQECQFEELVKKLGIKKDLSRNPLFNVVFDMLNEDFSKLEFGSLELSLYEQKPIARFDLTLFALEKEEGIDLAFRYSTALFEESTIRKLAEHYTSILTQTSNHPGIKLGDIEVPGYLLYASHKIDETDFNL